MNAALVRLVVYSVLYVITLTQAHAAPPQSCVDKFVGNWSYSGGTTYIHPDGTANPVCFMCVSVQTWTCSGDTYIITGPTSYTATLSADGTQMVGSAGVAIRIDGTVVKGPSSPPDQSGLTFTADPFTNETPRNLAHAIWLAKGYAVAAQASEQICTYDQQMKAAENYRTAARFFAQAHDVTNENLVVNAAKAASSRADECDKRKTASRNKPKSDSQQGSGDEQDRCEAQAANMRNVAASASPKELAMFRVLAEGTGCHIPRVSGEGDVNDSKRGGCIRAKIRLRGVKMAAKEIEELLARAKCPRDVSQPTTGSTNR